MTRTVGFIALGGLALLAGCDDRPEERAAIALEGEQIVFNGDPEACLTLAYVRNEDADEDDEAYVWNVDAPEGGCLHFPLVFGTTPAGAPEMSGSGELREGNRYHFESGTETVRYAADFEPLASNGIFYVEDRNGEWTDIRRARQ